MSYLVLLVMDLIAFVLLLLFYFYSGADDTFRLCVFIIMGIMIISDTCWEIKKERKRQKKINNSDDVK